MNRQRLKKYLPHTLLDRFFIISFFLFFPSAITAEPICSTKVISHWWSGSHVIVKIKNPSFNELKDWRVKLNYPHGGMPTYYWNAYREGSNPATFQGPVWKPDLAPFDKHVFGFIGFHPFGLIEPSIISCHAGPAIVSDSDGDGVLNELDHCPNTPAGETVTANGCGKCQVDRDNDGVTDKLDLCPNTPRNAEIDADGCSWEQKDADGDGIFNGLDQCSDTAPNEMADDKGCSLGQLDDDNDGISNALDNCPTTPVEDLADQNGCGASQRDSDQDGIYDVADLCPETPLEETSNAQGCGNSQLDDDHDGVVNTDDMCPESMEGEEVDAQGCGWGTRDDDGDQTKNGFDSCPETPLDEPTNEDGCSLSQLDDDEDGVTNDKDLCPETLMTPVTEYGCHTFADNDNDFILNAHDLCPFSPGLVQLRGCKPMFDDFDSDGIPDALDECPLTLHPGAFRLPNMLAIEDDTLSSNGCTLTDQLDFDGDGVVWSKDVCWRLGDENTSGDVFDNGCPASQNLDTDKDGLINALDVCPEQFGSPLANGCQQQTIESWDIDGDGIGNTHDNCPFSPESMDVSPNGCLMPLDAMQIEDREDRDLDGVIDGQDECLFTPFGHVVDLEGCTSMQRSNFRDVDGDGVINRFDLCNNSLSPMNVSAFGCLVEDAAVDQDFDGLPDEKDACPERAGLDLHFGCPTSLTDFYPLNNAWNAELNDRDLDGTADHFDTCPYSRVTPGSHLKNIVDMPGCNYFDLKDTDLDGVPNGRDRCPRTVSPSHLDNEGCNDFERLDLDGDSLINGVDLCPNHYGYWQLNGCALSRDDSDLDGVNNKQDQCPLSLTDQHSSSINIDPNTGCSLDLNFDDDDEDGVVNGNDQCPNTLKGQFVIRFESFSENPEITGCSDHQITMRQGDDDGDGIANSYDTCPNTDTSSLLGFQRVNKHGCFDPNGDDDKDLVLNNEDECHQDSPNVPVASNGCNAIYAYPVKSALKLSHLPKDALPSDTLEFTLQQEDWLFRSPPTNEPIRLEVKPTIWGQDIQISTMQNARPKIQIWVAERLRDKPIYIPFRVFFENTGVYSNWSQLVLLPDPHNVPRESLIVNDNAVLSASGIALSDVFSNLARAIPSESIRLFKQFWASQKSDTGMDSPFTCSGPNFSTPVCDRLETNVALMDDSDVQKEMDRYKLVAVVNALHDRADNWDDCGEQRMIFSLQNDSRGSINLNVSARIPSNNGINGCLPLIKFWRDLPHMSKLSQAAQIRDAFIENTSGVMGTPFIHPDHFSGGYNGGKIQSNQSIGGEWLLREHRLVNQCDEGNCWNIETVAASGNPVGELFQSSSGLWFDLEVVVDTGLSHSSFSELQFNTPEYINRVDSFSSGGDAMENDFLSYYLTDPDPMMTDFILDAVLANKVNADNSPVLPEQVFARATGMTCAGCHNPEIFGITGEGKIGSLSLPDGSLLSQWPKSQGFTHINDKGELSPALKDVFIPIRQHDFISILEQLKSSSVSL